MASWIKSEPPRMEIADLDIPKSDPRYASAVKCVRTYWKQATRLTVEQRKRFLGFLASESKVDYLSKTPVTLHILYTSARNYQGEFPVQDICWADYLFLSSLYQCLPQDYVAAVMARYYTITVTDYTEEYRSYHPEPTSSCQKKTTESTKVSQPVNVNLTHIQEVLNKQQKVSPAQQKDGGVRAISSQKPNAAAESSAKRVRLYGDEILEKVNLQAEIIQQAMDKFSEKQDNQDNMLHEVREAIEQNKQALEHMQSELRQFMSAVATTFRNIQERLDQ
ncbi:hypothetical protein TrVFT333_010438 [Trichoderma virens FT-333]|nr:hypothetical protein TrVFT333_010438 [Trichoderma virens FT-333]